MENQFLALKKLCLEHISIHGLHLLKIMGNTKKPLDNLTLMATEVFGAGWNWQSFVKEVVMKKRPKIVGLVCFKEDPARIRPCACDPNYQLDLSPSYDIERERFQPHRETRSSVTSW